MEQGDPADKSGGAKGEGHHAGETVLGQLKVHQQEYKAERSHGPADQSHERDHIRCWRMVAVENQKRDLRKDRAKQRASENYQAGQDKRF